MQGVSQALDQERVRQSEAVAVLQAVYDEARGTSQADAALEDLMEAKDRLTTIDGMIAHCDGLTYGDPPTPPAPPKPAPAPGGVS